MVTVGIDLNKVYEYKIYVKTSDYEKNVISDEYNQIRLNKMCEWMGNYGKNQKFESLSKRCPNFHVSYDIDICSNLYQNNFKSRV